MDKKFYITTPIYYANGAAHLGHFLTTSIADVLARYYRSKLGSENVFFTTGLDEHGTTVEQAATKEGYPIEKFQEYVDKKAVDWKRAFDETNISYDYFVRTTNKKHEEFAQEFIKKMLQAKDIYKSTYKGKYCNGCEKFLTLSDLDERGLCPLHRPDQVVEIEEENYFFKLSKYAPRIKQLIEEGEIDIKPENRRNEILSRLQGTIDDISISRPKKKVNWGIEFPDDTEQTIYVWVEALMNYYSSLIINDKEEFWPSAHHLLGKDINWFHTVIWPSFLLSAGYPLYKSAIIHGFLNIGGAKISKSLGNVITPLELVEHFNIDGARYLILSTFPLKDDTDITWDYLKGKYTADLSNGLGNLVSRVAKLAELQNIDAPQSKLELIPEFERNIEEYRFNQLLDNIWGLIRITDGLISEEKLWENTSEKLDLLQTAIVNIQTIAYNLIPFLPETADKILEQFKGPKIKSAPPLFPRLEK